MKAAAMFLILAMLCIGVIALFFIADNANTASNQDSFNTTDKQVVNMARGNVSAVMPVGFTLMSAGAIVVSVIIVVIIVLFVAGAHSSTRQSYRR